MSQYCQGMSKLISFSSYGVLEILICFYDRLSAHLDFHLSEGLVTRSRLRLTGGELLRGSKVGEISIRRRRRRRRREEELFLTCSIGSS